MMQYDRPVKVLLCDFAASQRAGELFTRADIRAWFQANYLMFVCKRWTGKRRQLWAAVVPLISLPWMGQGIWSSSNLKVSRGHENTVGQILRYMGFTKREYAHNRKVRGIIIAAKISSGLRLAAEPLKDAGLDIKLMQYDLKFELSSTS